tara:strand:+ start:1437 stop:2261 length:825 start_codon:yes stop_codon:yes gene_type:complete
MDRIPTLILTRNRACQARLLLESLYVNATGIFDPYVIYKADDDDFEAGYRELKKDFKHARFFQEEDMLSDLYSFLKHFSNDYFALFMDDCIFYKPLRYTAKELIQFLDDDTWCVSLRLGHNTRDNTSSAIKEVYSSADFIKYKFKDYGVADNYGFYFSWDGVIYKTQDVLDLFNDDDFSNTDNPYAILPQRIENFTQHKRDTVKKNLICCPKESHVVCMNYNTTHTNADFDYYPLQELNQNYLFGRVIDLSTINFDNIKGTHDYRPFVMRRRLL